MRKTYLALIAVLTLVVCIGVIALGYFLIKPSIKTTSFVSFTPAPIAADATPAVDNATAANNTPSTETTAVAQPGSTPQPSTPPAQAGSVTRVPTSSSISIIADARARELADLEAIQYPSNDRIALEEEFKGVSVSVATPAVPKQYHVGDRETFWVNRDMQSQNEKITATLHYMNNVVYMWVEDGERVDEAALKKSADVFANKIYPTDRKYLGSEANPGVDNDPHLHILNTRFENASGYFSQSDTLPVEVNRHSNDKEMFYINTQSLRPGSQVYESVLSHEFAHMIHRNQNPRGESSWITEGFGDLGIELNGYQSGHEEAFAQDPDLQLTAWASLPGLAIPHYGAAYLFMSYQLNRFGADYIRDVFSTNTTGIATIERALSKDEGGLSFDSIFADWVVANFINTPELGKRYNYGSGSLNIRPTAGYNQYPVQASDTVHQYGTDYIQMLPNGKDVTFTFDGADTVRAIPTDPYGGKYMWWSGRTDFSDSKLTREFDLTAVKKATLKFETWYDLEKDFDYAYVSASTDGGKTWQTLKGNTTTDSDPNAANYGNAFNCKSDAGCDNPDAQPKWIQETVDLSAYAGKKVLLRFEQITDEVFTAPGFAIDNIEIPEIGFSDNAENGDNGWQAQGFARIDNILPQHFIVQAIEFGATGTQVVPIQLDAQNRGTYTTNGFGKNLTRVVITISGSTPVTWETTDYQYQIR